MSAVPSSPRESQQHSFSLTRMQVDDLPEVLAIENDVYPFPWTHGNFLDSLYSSYEIWIARDANAVLVGYLLLMLSVDEAHLLNIAVRRDLQGQGMGRMLLDHAVGLAREKGMQSILLEVRPSNDRAVVVYEHYGFAGIGVRKGYYPAGENRREDAIVMRLPI
jgi:ribosomal-protein-alanine N-acetyltransferase